MRNHRGEHNPNRVLTHQLVREVRRLHENGFGYGWIATWLGVSRSCVQKVVKKRTWAQRKG